MTTVNALKAHFDDWEAVFASASKLAGNTSHPNHKGGARESILFDFLQDHLPQTVAIGTGEIIDCDSALHEKRTRNQFDVIVYRRGFPKLQIARNTAAFLAESVVATIEVKSTLTYSGLKQAVSAALAARALKRKHSGAFIGPSGGLPPIRNYVVAYSGPKRMATTKIWIDKIHRALSIKNAVPRTEKLDRILNLPSPSVDDVFVWGKGSLGPDLVGTWALNSKTDRQEWDVFWNAVDKATGNLGILFFQLVRDCTLAPLVSLDSLPYLAGMLIERTEAEHP